EGKFKIGKAAIKVSGKTYETEPLSVEVVAGKAQEEIEEDEKIFFKAEMDKDSAVVGEPVIVDYVVYFAINIDRFNIVEEPSFEGFYATMLRNYDGSTYKTVINGIQYGRRIIRRYIVYPQTPGEVTVDPFTLRVSVPLSRNAGPRDPFAMLRPTESFIIDSNPVEVEVSPLPSPVPPSFTNAIGKYNATAILDKTNLTTDDAITMTLNIYGEGDIKRVTAPNLILSDSFEVYEPSLKAEDANEKNGKPYGKKTYEYLILPKAVGQFTIAPEFSYYDVDSSKFVTATTATYKVNIRKGVNPIRTNVKPIEETVVQQEIHSIKTSYTLGKKKTFAGSGLFYILMFLPFFLLAGAIA
ncbi:MAG: BatD family protein, partial [Saprospiraceae bacterium]